MSSRHEAGMRCAQVQRISAVRATSAPAAGRDGRARMHADRALQNGRATYRRYCRRGTRQYGQIVAVGEHRAKVQTAVRIEGNELLRHVVANAPPRKRALSFFRWHKKNAVGAILSFVPEGQYGGLRHCHRHRRRRGQLSQRQNDDALTRAQPDSGAPAVRHSMAETFDVPGWLLDVSSDEPILSTRTAQTPEAKAHAARVPGKKWVAFAATGQSAKSMACLIDA